MIRTFFLLIALFVAMPAHAGKIAIVDFQRAMTETAAGKAATARIEEMYKTRVGEIQRMENELTKEFEDFNSRAMILSEQAQQEAQQSLMMKKQRYDETRMQYDAEIQQALGNAQMDLAVKIKAVAEQMGKENNYDLVIDAQAVLYAGDSVVDMTDDLVKRYDATNK